jgi:hypothetical protein
LLANDALPGSAPYASSVSLRFLGDVHHLRHGDLHPVGELVLADAGERFGIAELGQLQLVELLQGVEAAAADLAAHAGRVVGVQDRIADAPALHALIDRRQIAGAPEGLAAGRIGPAADQHDEPRQVLVLGPEAIRDPRAHRRAAIAGRAGVEKQLGWGVVELVGVHRLHDAQIVGDILQIRPQLAHFDPGLAMPRKLVWRAQHFRPAGLQVDKRQPLLLQNRQQVVRAGLQVVLDQLGLIVPQIVLRRRARHVQVDHPFHFGRQRRRLWGEGVVGVYRGGSCRTISKQRLQSDGSQAESCAIQEMSPRIKPAEFMPWVHSTARKTLAEAPAKEAGESGYRYECRPDPGAEGRPVPDRADGHEHSGTTRVQTSGVPSDRPLVDRLP